jgi:hypothetical protein
MKQYLVFVGAGYYPMGGWQDFRGDFDDLGAAKERAKDVAKTYHSHERAWWHVVDTKNREKYAASSEYV